MKNILRHSVLLVFLFIGAISFGQSINISAGYSTSIVKLSDYEAKSASSPSEDGIVTDSYEIQRLPGFNAAISYEHSLGERLSLEAGLKYQTRGNEAITERSFVDPSRTWSEKNELTYRLKYIDLPIVLNTAITTGDLRVYARTGIYAGLMMATKYDIANIFTSSDGDNGTYLGENTLDISGYDLNRRITLGIVLGVGLEYSGFFFETNYNSGIFSLSDSDDNLVTNDLSFSLGYKIEL